VAALRHPCRHDTGPSEKQDIYLPTLNTDVENASAVPIDFCQYFKVLVGGSSLYYVSKLAVRFNTADLSNIFELTEFSSLHPLLPSFFTTDFLSIVFIILYVNNFFSWKLMFFLHQ